MENRPIEILLIFIPSLTYALLLIFYSGKLKKRKKEIDGKFTEKAANYYYQAFGHSKKDAAEKPANDKVSDKDKTVKEDTSTIAASVFWSFNDWTEFVIPFLLIFITLPIAIDNLMSRGIIPYYNHHQVFIILKKNPGIFGMLGAFVWSIYDILQKINTISLTPFTLYKSWLKLIVGAGLGYMIAPIMDSTVSPLIAFALGSFPLEDIFSFLQNFVAKKLDFKPNEKSSEPPTLQHIQGMTPEVIEILNDEGINSCQHLAYADPVRLLYKTKIEFDLIIDFIDQALLYIYYEENSKLLRQFSIRGAIEVAEIDDYFLNPTDSSLTEKDKSERRQRGEKIIAAIALKLNVSVDVVYNLIETLTSDAHVNLIWELWDDGFDEVLDPENNPEESTPELLKMNGSIPTKEINVH